MDKPKPWNLDTCYEIYKNLYDTHGSVVFTEKWIKSNNHNYLYYRLKKLGSNITLFCEKYDLITERNKSKNIIKNLVNDIVNIDLDTNFADIKEKFKDFLETNNDNNDDLLLLEKCKKESEIEDDLNKRHILKHILFGFKMKKRYPNAIWYYDDTNILDYTKVIIPEFPAYYATIYGYIHSKRNNRKHTDKASGLRNHNGKTKKYTHQFICLAFHGEKPSDIHTVDHININHSDNRPYNLRWATPSEQALNKDMSNFGKGAHRKIVRTDLSNDSSIIFNSLLLSIKDITHNRTTDTAALSFLKRSINKNDNKHWGYEFTWWIPEDLGNLQPIKKDEFFTTNNWYVSNTGWVKTSQNVYTKGSNDREGYKQIKAGKKRFRVHRLIFKTFKPDLYRPYPLYVINHKNGIKDDNNIMNLECITNKENVIHAIETGLTKNTSKKIIQFSLTGEKIAIFDNAILAAKSVSNAEHACKSIRSCCKGEKQKTAYGYSWKYET